MCDTYVGVGSNKNSNGDNQFNVMIIQFISTLHREHEVRTVHLEKQDHKEKRDQLDHKELLDQKELTEKP